ncbi:MAG: hypothetical protein AAB676_04475 [Verrucomicrobiota bacterium]
MSLELRLEFDHWGKELRFSKTRFKNPALNLPDSEMADRFHVGELAGRYPAHELKSRIFPWHAPAKGLAVLLLRSFAEGKFNPFLLEGAQGSLASALWDMVRKQPAWLTTMFPLPGKAQLQTTYFQLSKETDKAGRTIYQVTLNPCWNSAKFSVLVDGKPAADDYEKLAREIANAEAPIAPEADLDVWVWSDRQRRFVSAREPGALPVRFQTKLWVEATLYQPACCYLVWRSSHGQAHSLYPWQSLDFSGAVKDRPVSEVLRLPAAKKGAKRQTFFIDTPAGVETLVLLVRSRPMPAAELRSLKDLLSLPADGLAFGEAEYYRDFEWREADEAPGGQPKLGLAPWPVTDALDQFHQDLINRFKTRCALVQGLSFANAGTTPKGGQP